MSDAVRHEPDRHRFVAATEDGEAVLEYAMAGDVYVLAHTLVPEAAEGQGVGSRLARAALAHAEGEGAEILPQCPFVAAYVERHPEWRRLVAASAGL